LSGAGFEGLTTFINSRRDSPASNFFTRSGSWMPGICKRICVEFAPPCFCKVGSATPTALMRLSTMRYAWSTADSLRERCAAEVRDHVMELPETFDVQFCKSTFFGSSSRISFNFEASAAVNTIW
jgi:hypothetical protein